MRQTRGYMICLILFVLAISSFVVYAKNTTLKTELFFIEGINKSSSLTLTGTIPGKTYEFYIIVDNVWDVPATVHMGFVDGVRTNDAYANKACLHEGDNIKLGQYITGPNDFLVDPRTSVTTGYTLNLPTGYQYTGLISACITHYPSFSGDDIGMFDMQARRANFLDIYVVSGDLIVPEILSINPVDGQSNVSINNNIIITFSERMDNASVKNNISLNPVIGGLSYVWSDNILTISHSSAFVYGENYTLTIGTGAKDLAGNPIDTIYLSNFVVEAKPSGGGGGGGSGVSKPKKDNCPDGDNSGDLYDGDCGEYSEVEEDIDVGTGFVPGDHGGAYGCSIEESDYSDELNQSYIYACNMGITTMQTIDTANMMGPLLRKHLAKMISEFSVKVIGNSPELTKKCVFSDMGSESKEMQYYAKTSCQLYLMGLHPNGIDPKDVFDPNDIVTRAQFGTVLSRLLWQTQYAANIGELYYGRHLEALRNHAIMTQIYNEWPNKQELRGRVMLMLMRVNENKLTDDYISGLGHAAQGGIAALLDDGEPHVTIETFGDNPYYTDIDFIPIKGKLDSDNISKIRVTHMDSNGIGAYNNYFLQKFKAGDTSFVFYAYKHYNSLTINDMNKYKFDFFDKDSGLIFTKTVWVDHNYVENR